MAQIFHPATNTIAKVSILGGLGILAALVWAGAQFHRSPYMTQVGVAREQPIPFSHKHHVQGLGIDCRYCHTSVEESAVAGIPPAATCMNCHSVIWKEAPMLEPLRQSFKTGTPIEWTRVHDLPDFVYFDHSIHVQKGVACATCHGPVNEMPLTWRTETLHMEWCLSCHRNPEPSLRPRDKVFDMTWHPPVQGKSAGWPKKPVASAITNCSVCHR